MWVMGLVLCISIWGRLLKRSLMQSYWMSFQCSRCWCPVHIPSALSILIAHYCKHLPLSAWGLIGPQQRAWPMYRPGSQCLVNSPKSLRDESPWLCNPVFSSLHRESCIGFLASLPCFTSHSPPPALSEETFQINYLSLNPDSKRRKSFHKPLTIIVVNWFLSKGMFLMIPCECNFALSFIIS